MRQLLTIFFFVLNFALFAQQKGTIYGTIKDEKGKVLDLVNVAVYGTPGGTSSNAKGYYELSVDANKDLRIVISSIGYTSQYQNIRLSEGQRSLLNITLKTSSTDLNPFTIESRIESEKPGYTRISTKEASRIPAVAGGGVEALVKTQMGVSSSNELSSQYNVRGGNYDENLIYVNGIEIYRPFLIRSGQQEGLSFINSDLVNNINFSAGGFEAIYGDKMSSVLDIEYKEPTEFAGSAQMSLLGASLHLENSFNENRTSILFGARYKSNSYLLKSMETKGDYKPSFTDIQGLLSHKLNKNLDINLLVHYSNNKFKLVPENRETSFGTIQDAVKLTIYFDGQEIDKFNTLTSAFYINWKANDNNRYRFILSTFQSYESENYDIQGQYWLDDLETDFGKDDFGDVTFNRGVGTFLEHARNRLNANVSNAEIKGSHRLNNHHLDWGVKYQFELISDRVDEWIINDSAGYITPHHPDNPGVDIPIGSINRDLNVSSFFFSENSLASSRLSAYVQDTWKFDGDSSRFFITAGSRFQYWSVNNQFLASPRVSAYYKPVFYKSKTYRMSVGLYHQPPFYREMRDLNGNINLNVKAQQSIHFVLGYDASFKAWDRPFKFTSEVYYKHLSNLIPYEIDNVRIRYYAENSAKGYAGGIDMKLIGEFVPGIDSWFSLSIMQTKEDIFNDFYYRYYDSNGQEVRPSIVVIPHDSAIFYPGYIPRPTDQRLNANIFFQDYIPNNPMFKMHLNLAFGTGLPFGAPGKAKHTHTFRMPPYRRVDIGFSAQLLSEAGLTERSGYWKHIKSAWVSLEIFNLLQISNTVSYIWISDINNNKMPVPNYLTPRQLNAKLIVEF